MKVYGSVPFKKIVIILVAFSNSVNPFGFQGS